jgi:hypothetical protein
MRYDESVFNLRLFRSVINQCLHYHRRRHRRHRHHRHHRHSQMPHPNKQLKQILPVKYAEKMHQLLIMERYLVYHVEHFFVEMLCLLKFVHEKKIFFLVFFCFFQDAIQCRYGGHCDVNILTRKVCTSCRLAKCLNVGMSPDLIRKEDLYGRKRKLSKSKNQDHILMVRKTLKIL